MGLFSRSKKDKEEGAQDAEAQVGDFQSYAEASLEGLQLLSDAHAQTWGFGKAQKFDIDMGRGVIAFTFEDRIVTAPIQIIGTYNTENGTFLWGWDHPSVSDALAQAAIETREFGENYGFELLTTRTLECSEDDAWNFTAVAARVTKANGAYRAPAGPTLVFVTFGEVTMRKA